MRLLSGQHDLVEALHGRTRLQPVDEPIDLVMKLRQVSEGGDVEYRKK